MEIKMKIALIAHDKKKSEIIELAKQYKDVLGNYELYATGTTGTLIMGETALPIHRMKSGPLGGDQQIGAMLANGEHSLTSPTFRLFSGFVTYRRYRLRPTRAARSLCLSP